MATRAVTVARASAKPRMLAWAVAALFAVLVPVLAPSRLAAAELLMFEKAGCPWCDAWDRDVAPAYEKSAEGKRAPLRRLDIRVARTAGYRLATPVTVTPTFVLVDNGAEVGRITGYPGADFFWGLLGELMVRLPPAAPPPTPLRDASARDPARSGRGPAVAGIAP